jgi:hypothetical protein
VVSAADPYRSNLGYLDRSLELSSLLRKFLFLKCKMNTCSDSRAYHFAYCFKRIFNIFSDILAQHFIDLIVFCAVSH